MQPNPQTVLVLVIFAIIYTYRVTFKTAKRKIDLYDFIMLSSVAVLPIVFVSYPKLAEGIAKIVGVTFPFLILFGVLFVILFLFIHRMTSQIHKLESENRLLIQEVSTLKLGLSEAIGKVKSNS